MDLHNILMGISFLTPLWIFADFYKKKDLHIGVIYVIVFYTVLLVGLPLLIKTFSYQLVFFVPLAVGLFVFILRIKKKE
jgi:hypothetical protein